MEWRGLFVLSFGVAWMVVGGLLADNSARGSSEYGLGMTLAVLGFLWYFVMGGWRLLNPDSFYRFIRGPEGPPE